MPTPASPPSPKTKKQKNKKQNPAWYNGVSRNAKQQGVAGQALLGRVAELTAPLVSISPACG